MGKTSLVSRHVSTNGGLRISYAGIGAAVGLLIIAGTIWGIGSKLATKSDIESIKATISPILDRHESRIRDIELQLARFFGAQQTRATPSGDTEPVKQASYILAQYQQQQDSSANKAALVMQRRVVVPQELIEAYNLQPARGGSYTVLGEDQRFYSLDDVLAVIIRMHLQERPLRMKK